MKGLTALLWRTPEPYVVGQALLHQLIPAAEAVVTLFDEHIERLKVAALDQEGEDDEGMELLEALSSDSAAFADFLAEIEFGRLFSEGAHDLYGKPGIPLVAYALLKVALEVDWRLAALQSSPSWSAVPEANLQIRAPVSACSA